MGDGFGLKSNYNRHVATVCKVPEENLQYFGDPENPQPFILPEIKMEVPVNVDEQQAYENWGYVQEGMNPYVNNPNYASNNPNYASHDNPNYASHVEEEQQNYISNEPE